MEKDGSTSEILRTLIEHVNDIPYVSTQAGKLLYFGNQCIRYGYDPEEVMARGVMDYIHPHDRERVAEELLRGLTTGEVFPTVFRILTSTGEVRWLEDHGRTVCDAEGHVTGLAGVLRDVTDRVLAEEALRESEERLRQVFEQGPFAMAMSGKDFRFYKVNAAFCSMFGYTEQELADLTFKEITHPEHVGVDIENVEKLARGEIPVYKTEKRYIAKSGEALWGSLTLSVIRDSSGEFLHFLVLIENIDERRRAESALQIAQRFESLSVLAGGIAHDFNNLLVGILGNIDLARMQLPPGSTAARHLQRAISISDRASSLTQQLLTFSRGGAPVMSHVALPDLISTIVRFTLSGSNVASKLSIPEDLWACRADEAQLARAVENILINARQAMPTGGTITITAENLTLAEADVPPLAQGRYVAIAVTDQGEGIPERARPHIFDPFFTTKVEGTGLGLSTAFSIVKRHGGHVDVRSEVGEGSTFTMYLPASKSEERAEPTVRSEVADACELSILLMDDEVSVRVVAAEMLRLMGHVVTEVESGGQAIEAHSRAAKEGRPFDVVILDLTIPGGVGGQQVVEELVAIDPSVVAIASSGYSEDPVMAEPERFGFKASLSKPYLYSDLLRVIQAVCVAVTRGRPAP